MKISNDFVNKATPDFWIGEYWHGIDFDLSDPVIAAGQIHRDFFGMALTCTNTYPDGQTWGYHCKKMAGDWTATDPKERQSLIDKYNHELLNYINGLGSVLIYKLRAAGINGFGLENVCIHNDSRPQGIDPDYKTEPNRIDKYGKYCAFKFQCHYDATGKMIVDINEAI